MKYLKIAFCALLFIGGIAIGVFIKDYPIIQFNKELKIYEVFNLILTAAIGLLIPFFIKRWIEDNRQVKNNLIDELKDALREVAIVKDKIKFCYHNKAISQSDKQEITVMFEQADLKIQCLEQQFIESFDIETKTIRAEIKTEYLAYWKLATGGEIMNAKFKSVNENFFRRHNECFTKVETKIKQAINKVHRI